MKNFQINFRKHWFTDVKPISKNRDKKSFLLKFKDFMMEMKRHWIPKNFELTFPVFFHHNFKEIYHLVRVTDLKSLQFLKSPLFIRFKGWLWKFLVFEFVRSKGYPFTKNPSFLIILIKIRQYPWDFILEKIHDFQRNFEEIVKILKIFFDFSFPLFMIFLDISQFLEWLSKEK